MSATLGLQYI